MVSPDGYMRSTRAPKLAIAAVGLETPRWVSPEPISLEDRAAVARGAALRRTRCPRQLRRIRKMREVTVGFVCRVIFVFRREITKDSRATRTWRRTVIVFLSCPTVVPIKDTSTTRSLIGRVAENVEGATRPIYRRLTDNTLTADLVGPIRADLAVAHPKTKSAAR